MKLTSKQIEFISACVAHWVRVKLIWIPAMFLVFVSIIAGNWLGVFLGNSILTCWLALYHADKWLERIASKDAA